MFREYPNGSLKVILNNLKDLNVVFIFFGENLKRTLPKVSCRFCENVAKMTKVLEDSILSTQVVSILLFWNIFSVLLLTCQIYFVKLCMSYKIYV